MNLSVFDFSGTLFICEMRSFMGTKNTEIIAIRTSEYLSENLALQISNSLWEQPDIAGLRTMLYFFKSETDYFNVIAQSSSGDFVGRLYP